MIESYGFLKVIHFLHIQGQRILFSQFSPCSGDFKNLDQLPVLHVLDKTGYVV